MRDFVEVYHMKTLYGRLFLFQQFQNREIRSFQLACMSAILDGIRPTKLFTKTKTVALTLLACFALYYLYQEYQTHGATCSYTLGQSQIDTTCHSLSNLIRYRLDKQVKVPYFDDS